MSDKQNKRARQLSSTSPLAKPAMSPQVGETSGMLRPGSKWRIVWIGSMVSGINTHQTSLLEILNNLARRGHTVTLVGARPRKELTMKNPSVNTIFVPLLYVPALFPIVFSLAMLLFLPFYIVLRKPDFVFYQPDITVVGSIPVSFIARLARTKLVLDIRSIPVETTGLRGFLQKLGFNCSVNIAKRCFKGLTIITSPMKREISEAYKLDSNKIGVWTSGVSAYLFDPEAYISESEGLRKELGLTGRFVVFYHGAFSATRGIVETVQAMKQLKPHNPEIVLFLLGAGPVSPHLEDLVRREKLEQTVLIHEPVDYSEVPKYIAISDVCISPLPFHHYWNYQSPLKLMEYLSMKKPVILTSIPAHKSVIDGEACGIYISSTEPNTIADAIRFAYENKNKLGEWGKTGRRIVTEKYTWEKIAEGLENYLQSVEKTASEGGGLGKE